MNVIKAYQCITFLLKSRLYQKMRAVIYIHHSTTPLQGAAFLEDLSPLQKNLPIFRFSFKIICLARKKAHNSLLIQRIVRKKLQVLKTGEICHFLFLSHLKWVYMRLYDQQVCLL